MAELKIDYLSEIERELVAQAQKVSGEWLHDSNITKQNKILLDILTTWNQPANYLIVALLLPVLREEFILDESIIGYFDPQIVHMVQLVNQLTYSQYIEDKATETRLLRDLFINAYIDPKLVLLCIADHLATTAVLNELDEDSQTIWLQKTFLIYLPLLDMFGMWEYRQDIGSLGLALRDMDLYEDLQKSIVSFHNRYDEVFYYVRELLSSHPIIKNTLPDVRLHFTSVIGLYMQAEQARQRGDKYNLYTRDTLRIDIIVENVSDCYVVLGLIHELWRPTYHKADSTNIKLYDYIARPHFNGYRSLVTTVLCEIMDKSHLVEFRIATQEMFIVNANGYIDVTKPIKNVWWNVPNLVQAIKKRGSDDLVVFTSKGESIYPVKAGSTVLDLAFRIHSGLGPYARQFWVNGRKVSESYVVQHCDLLEIIYDKQYPSIHISWLEHVQTSRAKNSIKRFLKSLERQPHRGRQLIDRILERESHIYRMRLSEAQVEAALVKAARSYGCPTLETLYVKVLEGDVSPDQIVASMIEDELINHIVPENGYKFPTTRIRIARTWMLEKGAKKLDRNFRVMPGNEIVGRLKGKSKKHLALIVYRKDDPLISNWKKMIPLRWRSGSSATREYVEITIAASSRPRVTTLILNTVFSFSDRDGKPELVFHQIHAENEDNVTNINLTIDVPSFTTVREFQNLLDGMQQQGNIINYDVWQLFPGQKMKIVGKLDKRQQNPYTLRQIRDQGMFFGRESEIDQVIQQINEGQNFIVIYGQKRIGKTSLLHQLSEHFLPNSCNVLAIPFDSHSISPFDSVQFILGLVDATINQLASRDRQGLRLKKRDVVKDPFRAFASWVRKVEQRIQGTKLFFIIDEFTRAEEECERGRLTTSFFDGMQWWAGTQNIGLILCVHDNIYRQASRSWGMMQRAYPVRFDTLEEPAAIRLIRQPLEHIYEFDFGVVERIVKLTNCHPYFIHAICLELTTYMSKQESNRITNRDLESAVNRVLRTGDHYFSHFRSAVDEYSWITVKAIAYSGSTDDDWVARSDIHHAMLDHGDLTNRWQISEAISQLYRAGIIEARQSGGAIAYRISVGLFQFWLRQQTHPLISRDMKRED